MRIANVRILAQAMFLALFLLALYLMAAPRIAGFAVSIFLEADPLVAVATVLSTGHLYHVGATGLFVGILLLLLTVLLGRFFCGWICPFGTLHHVAHWLGFPRSAKRRIDGNTWRPLYATKYVVLALFLGAALLGSLQIGLLDPIAFLTRSVTDAVFPVVDAALQAAGLDGLRPGLQPTAVGAWFLGLLFVALLVLNLWRPRFFCRVLCPLGALLGIFSRFSLYRIHRDPAACNGCNLCRRGCEGAAEPQAKVRTSECMVCMNCLEDCPEGAISFGFLPPRDRAVDRTGLSGRRAALAALGGAGLAVLLETSGAAEASSQGRGVLRPPGSLPESPFLARCLKCDACLNVCPTNVLQPALFEAGFAGLWTPVLDLKDGYCDVTCTLCGHVCPTGAIERLTPAQRQGLEARADGSSGPVVIGTANYDRGRCLPWAMDKQCVVCEEVCPVSPKAIFTREETVVGRDGTPRKLRRPFVDADKCVGCGICEHECPIRGPAAVRVGSRIVTV